MFESSLAYISCLVQGLSNPRKGTNVTNIHACTKRERERERQKERETERERD